MSGQNRPRRQEFPRNPSRSADDRGGRRPGRSRDGRGGTRRPLDRPRRTALEALRDIGRSGAYANLACSRLLAEQRITGRDAAFVTELVFGTCRMAGSYDAIIEQASGRSLDDLEPDLVDVLRLGAHQGLAMRVPDRAAVDTSVDLAAHVVGERACGITNAVMRRIIARPFGQWCTLIAGDDPDRERELRTGHPRWIIDAYADLLGPDELEPALAADNEAAEPTLVVRPGLCERDELLAAGATPTRWSPWGAHRGGDPAEVEAVRTGRAGVQDEGGQLVCLALSRAEGLSGPRWLDLCAGPGGKSALLRGLAAEHGAFLVANEAQPHRARLVSLALRRYDRSGHQMIVADGSEPAWDEASFQAVLADVPCSGLGALRRRPESRWRRLPADLDELVPLQQDLLDVALGSVPDGGLIAYVTCSPHRAETADVVASVEDRVELLDAPSLIPEVPDTAAATDPRFVQLWPHRHGTDAMFLALMRRR
ncbi:transcription antitermination factor NusB [uncultured Propionibacterium sp.]|uniref:RsmB/NOP family class I SAM-dependent RNA methyltransferase n=1 Tax=uncultured Propionibacterium sp. TaxID=218066 RepID=UPI00292F3172|nr:transcription antitermination factor NusB [uncultured Propionibacterium sp.]